MEIANPDAAGEPDAPGEDVALPVDGGSGLQAVGWYRGRFVTDRQSLVVGYELSQTPIRLWTPESDGNFGVIEAERGDRGSFAARDIPPGRFWVQVNGWFIEGLPGQVFDFQVPKLGFPGYQWATPGTKLELSLTNLAPWEPGDELYLFSASAATNLQSLLDYVDPQPSPGQTSIEGKVDLFGFYNTPLIEGLVRGDETYVVQMRTVVRPGAGTFRVAERSLATSHLQVVAGATTTLAGQLRPTFPPSRLDVDWNPEAMLMLAREALPGLTDAVAELKFSATPGALVGLHAATGGPVDYDSGGAVIVWARTSPTAMPISFEHAETFPAAWPRTLEYKVGFRVPLPIPSHSGPPCAYHGSIGGAMPVPSGAATVTPTMKPPTKVEIDGHSSGDLMRNVGTNPLVRWRPPESNRPSGYLLQVFTVTPSPEQPCANTGSQSRLFTTAHEVQLPPGVLQAGRLTFVVVRAIYDPAYEESPLLTSNNSSYAEALSAVFLP